MKLILKLAWRGVWRNWRRSAITIFAVVFAALLSVVQTGMQEGTYAANIKITVEMFTGYIQIQKEGFMEKPTLRKSYKLDSELRQKIESVKEVQAYTPRIMSGGLVSFGNNTVGSSIFGIDPDGELKVSKLKDKVKEGDFITNDNIYNVNVGYKMLDNLDAKIGDTIVILSSGFDGSMGNHKFHISGLVKMGVPEFDASCVFMNIKAADELLSMYGRVNYTAIKLDDLEDIPIAKAGLSEILPDDIKALGWEEVLPDLKQSIEFDRSGGVMYLGILLVVIAFALLNTVLMSITERFNEFGIMLALGTKNSKLMLIVFFEILFIVLIGLLIGNSIAYVVNYIFYLNPIEIGGDMAQLYEEFGFVPTLYTTMDIQIFINTSISILIIGLLSFIYPAFRLKKLEALKGIRYT